MQTFFTYSYYVLFITELVMLIVWGIRYKYCQKSKIALWGWFWVVDLSLAIYHQIAQQSAEWPHVPEPVINLRKIFEFLTVLWLFRIHLSVSKAMLISLLVVFMSLWCYEFYQSFKYADAGLNESWMASCFLIFVVLIFSFQYIRKLNNSNAYFVTVPFFWVCVGMIINYLMALPAQIPSPITGEERYALIFYSIYGILNIIALYFFGYAFGISKNWVLAGHSKLKY